MFNFLKNHPFPVKSFFEQSLVLTYALPIELIKSQLPPCFVPDTFNDEYGFAAVAIVKTKSLRPAMFPSFLGNDFILVGYRVFVRYTNNAGKRLRGLYILGSETDKVLMKTLGSIFTQYKYGITDIEFSKEGPELTIISQRSEVNIKAKTTPDAILPEQSPFGNWKEARRFAGPLPFTFSYLEKNKEVLIVEGIRENWDPLPAEISTAEVGYMDKRFHGNYQLASAFYVENIPYQWKKGRIEKWRQ